MRSLLVISLLTLTACGPATLQKHQTQLRRVMESGELRVVTRNGPTTYYVGPDGPTGLEYDLARGFARYLGVKLKLSVADGYPDVLQAVEHGDVDVAAAGLAITDARAQRVRFGPTYQSIIPQVVYRSGNPAPSDIGNLQGVLHVVAGSSHAERLVKLRRRFPALTVEENQDLDSDQLLNLVWERAIDYTVVNSNELAINRRYYPELRVAFDLGDPLQLAWAFSRGDDDSLIEAAQRYFTKLQKNGRLAQLIERYYGHVGDFNYVETRRYLKHIQERLPRYRRWFVEAGAQTGIDWRLLAAVGYQESHWNPMAVSPTGVRGIMMITQDTMKQLGLSASRVDAQTSILGGAAYVKQIREMISEQIQEPDRTWMALASYNVGYGHLEDARILAERNGANPDRWVDIKEYLPLLSKRKWYVQTKNGYARGREPVEYVENIRDYYDILMWVTETGGLGRTRTASTADVDG